MFSADSSAVTTETLCVVVPVYNEESCVADVIREWSATLRELGISFELLVLNDGSRDKTSEALAQVTRDNPFVEVINKANSGHGQTCILGYRVAIERRAAWVFQIDSDGQCDPRYFADFWLKRLGSPVVLGRRVARGDGVGRRAISLLCKLATVMASGVPVRDPNVPYRLMRADVLGCAIEGFPEAFGLANVLVSVVLQKGLGNRLSFVDIGFRRRRGGEPSVRWRGFASAGVRLYRSLRQNRRYAADRAVAIANLMERQS
jgi:glycosyltransferase involved in cell wall biosynthesis